MRVATMRNRLWTLYLTLLKDHYGLSAAKYYYFKKRQRTWEPLVIVAGLRRQSLWAWSLFGTSRKSSWLGSPDSPIWRCPVP